MSVTKQLRGIILLTTCIPVLQVYTQPADTVLQNITVATKAIVEASNSITAGPNFTIAGTGDVTFVTDGLVYFRPRVVIIQGGKLRVGDSTLVVGDVRTLQAPIPTEFSLHQNYPNPFNPSTNIGFAVKEKSHVSLIVYNLLGQPVAALVNEDLLAGEYEAPFSSNGLASGVYFYRLVAGPFVETKKMLLLR
jgi:hypothetical protein